MPSRQTDANGSFAHDRAAQTGGTPVGSAAGTPVRGHVENPARDRLLQAILPHVSFDGWTEPAFEAAARDAGMTLTQARAVCPRGALDLAVAMHRLGDARMTEAAGREDLSALRYSERVARLVRLRIEAVAQEREAVRRAASLFALPLHAAEGAGLIWDTADAIWTVLGDTSRDLAWYTKRASLSAVYGSTVLYWLGDDSEDARATWEFLDRRIDDVMRFEQTKTRLRASPLGRIWQAGPGKLLERVQAPGQRAMTDLPGHVDLRPDEDGR